MQKITTFIEGCEIVKHIQHGDNRGFFQEIYKYGFIDFNIIQINHSFNKKYSLRGIHIAPFSKIVTCTSGRIIDICVDFRKNSPTYLKYYKIELNDSSTQIIIPPNCGHAFLSLEENTSVIYMQDGKYDPSKEFSIRYDSPQIGIDWVFDDSFFIVSEKDKSSTLFCN